MKKHFIKQIMRVSTISLIIGFVFILLSSSLAEFICTTVEQQGEGFIVTSMDPEQAFQVMISFIVFGSLISVGGISGLLMGSCLTYQSMSDVDEK